MNKTRVGYVDQNVAQTLKSWVCPSTSASPIFGENWKISLEYVPERTTFQRHVKLLYQNYMSRSAQQCTQPRCFQNSDSLPQRYYRFFKQFVIYYWFQRPAICRFCWVLSLTHSCTSPRNVFAYFICNFPVHEYAGIRFWDQM
jgi:hypothetical protein